MRWTVRGSITAIVLVSLLGLSAPATAADAREQLDQASLQLSDIPAYLSKDRWLGLAEEFLLLLRAHL